MPACSAYKRKKHSKAVHGGRALQKGGTRRGSSSRERACRMPSRPSMWSACLCDTHTAHRPDTCARMPQGHPSCLHRGCAGHPSTQQMRCKALCVPSDKNCSRTSAMREHHSVASLRSPAVDIRIQELAWQGSPSVAGPKHLRLGHGWGSGNVKDAGMRGKCMSAMQRTPRHPELRRPCCICGTSRAPRHFHSMGRRGARRSGHASYQCMCTPAKRK